MADRAFPGWLREPSGEAALDDPSLCYQHRGPFTGKPEVNFSIADDPPGTDPSASWYRNSSFPLGAPITLALTWQLRPPNMAALSARAS
jgi:hypothetical protein